MSSAVWDPYGVGQLLTEELIHESLRIFKLLEKET